VLAKASVADLTLIGEWMVAAKVKSVIDRRYPLADTAEALRYLMEGHARGKVIVSVDPG
jgi:NADPH:quinone reductase-like Zn-dependent oxidoreductase